MASPLDKTLFQPLKYNQMKKSLTRNIMLLSAVSMSMLASAQQRQVDLEIHIDEPANAEVFQSGQSFLLTVSITNHGPDEMQAGDSLFVITPSGEPTWGTLPEAIPVDGNFSLFSNEITMPAVETTTDFDLCVQLVDDPTTQIRLMGNPISVSYIDPAPGNNVICHTITVEAQPSSITETAKGIANLELYPNPAKDFVQVPIDPNGASAIQLRILDISGRIVFNQAFSQAAGRDAIQVDLTQFQNGVYILESQQGTIRNTGKFTILR